MPKKGLDKIKRETWAAGGQVNHQEPGASASSTGPQGRRKLGDSLEP